jgi:hypothetical protein
MLSTGLEVFQVLSVDQGAMTATVRGAMRGSTAANHASGDLVYVNPEFHDAAILRQLNHDLRDLSSPENGLFKVGNVTLVYNPSVVGYDLTGVTDLIDVLSIYAEPVDNSKDWRETSRKKWSLQRDADTAAFPSGLALKLPWDVTPDPGVDVRVTYKTSFGLLSSLSETVESVTGLPVTALDIPPLGAAARLVGAQESKRGLMGSQRDPRRAEEVPPGANIGGMRSLLALRAQRISSERARLYAKYPLRSVR